MKSRILLYIFVFLFCLFFLTGCTSKENVVISENLVEEGLELYEERYYVDAVEKFVEALEKYPANYEAYVGLVDVFLEKGWFEEAEDLAEEALSRVNTGQAASIYSMVGEGYYNVNEYEKAKEMYEKAVKADGDNEEGRIGLAKTNIQLGDVNQARKALGSKGESDEFLLLASYLTLDDWEEGVKKARDIKDENLRKTLEEIYDIDDEDVLYKNTSLSKEYINAGLPFLAIELLNKQSEEIEQYPDAQYFLGKAYLDYGEYDKALEKLSSAISLEMDDDDLYLNLARAYLFSENIEKSVENYEVILPYFIEEYIGVLLDNDMEEKAEDVLKELLEEEDKFELNILLSSVFYQQDELEKMSEVLAKLEEETDLSQSETRDLVRYRLLYLVENIDDVDEVETLVERYSVFDRLNPELYLFKGKLFIHEDKNLEAQEALERAIELDLEGDVTSEATELLASMN